MKSKGILFLATIVISVMILVVGVQASTSSFYATSGDDQTPSPFPLHHLLTPSDLAKVSSSDDIWYRNNGSWYADYQNTEYIEFGFSPAIERCSLLSTKVTVEWHTNSPVDEARILIYADGVWKPLVLGRAVCDERADSCEDEVVTFDVTADVNTLAEINNFKLRFQAKDDENSNNAWSYIDLIEFQVECDNTAPDTDVTFFTHVDRVSNPAPCEAGNVVLPYNSSIITHGTSTDESGVARADYGWDMLTLPWENIQNTEDETNWGDTSVNWFSPQAFVTPSLTEGQHRVCGRARDILGNQENPGITSVWQIPQGEDACCDVCIDNQTPPVTIKSFNGPTWPNGNDRNFYLSDRTLVDLTCTDLCAQNPNAPYSIPGSECELIQYKIKYCGDLTNCCNDSTPGTWSDWNGYDDPFNLGTEDGYYCLAWNSTDENGNVETTHFQNHKIDNEPPITTKMVGAPNYTGEPNYEWYVTSQTPFTLSCVDSQSGCDYTHYRIDGGDWINYQGQFTLNGYQFGVHTIEYQSVDNLGNWETIQTEIDFLDNEGPTIDIINPRAGNIGCDLLIFSVRATATDDGGVGLDHSNVTAKLINSIGSVLETVQLHLNGNVWEGVMNHSYPAGTYTVEVSAEDYLDNLGSDSVTINLVYDVYWTVYPQSQTVTAGSGTTTQFDYVMTLCHGGNAIAMQMEKLCGPNGEWLSPIILPSTIVEEIGFGGWNFVNLGNGNIALRFNAPSSVPRCSVLNYKIGVGFDDSTNPLAIVDTAFDITSIGNQITFWPRGPISGQQCTPNCSGKQCGDDGCGGSCGACETGVCQNYQCIEEQTHHGGGGGGSSSSTPTKCTESWTCTDWNACIGGTAHRSCVDSNKCGTETDKPAQIKTCEVPAAGPESNSPASDTSNTGVTGAAVGKTGKGSLLVGVLIVVVIVALALGITTAVKKRKKF